MERQKKHFTLSSSVPMEVKRAQTNAGFRACAPAATIAFALQKKLVRTEQLYRSPVYREPDSSLVAKGRDIAA